MSSLRDRMRQRAKQNQQKGAKYLNLPAGMEFYKKAKGSSNVAILPYKVSDPLHPMVRDKVITIGEEYFVRPFKVHYGIGAEDKAVICLTSVGKRCPICEERSRMDKDGSYSSKELEDLKPKDRELYLLNDIDDKNKVKMFEDAYFNFGKCLEKELIEQESDIGDGIWDFFRDEGGFNLKLRFDEESMGSGKPFLKLARVDFKDRRGPLPDSVFNSIIDLDKCLVIMTYDDMRALFLDLGTDDTDSSPRRRDNEPDDEPRARRGNDEQAQESGERPSRRREPEQEEQPRSRREPEQAPEQTPTRRRGNPEPEPEPEARRTDRREPEPEQTPARTRRADPPKEEPKEAAAPARTRQPEPEPEPQKAGTGDCPSGHQFGIDADKTPECNDCPTDCWEQCKKKTKEQEQEKGGGRRRG